jgi:hypothetical protein
MLLDTYNADELLANLYDDWRSLINRRAAADGFEREQLDQVYNRVLPYMLEIETARSHHDLCILGLIATAGTILQEYLKNNPIITIEIIFIRSLVTWMEPERTIGRRLMKHRHWQYALKAVA